MIRFAFSNGLFERPTLNLITRTYQQWYITADLLDYIGGNYVFVGTIKMGTIKNYIIRTVNRTRMVCTRRRAGWLVIGSWAERRLRWNQHIYTTTQRLQL